MLVTSCLENNSYIFFFLVIFFTVSSFAPMCVNLFNTLSTNLDCIVTS